MNRMISSVSHATARRRAAWLLVLFLITGSLAYPKPINWLLQKAQAVVGINLGQINKPFVLGLDLQGGTHLEYEADVTHVPEADRREALNGVRDVIERRINSLGVSEPLIQTIQAGNAWRVTVELAGISDINQAIKLIGETPILEFKEQNTDPVRELTPDESKRIETQNAEAKKKVDAWIADLKKPGADAAKIGEQTENEDLKQAKGDTGFLRQNPAYADIYQAVKEAPVAGTVLPQLVERDRSYAAVKIEEVKTTDKVEVNARHLLIGYKGAQGDLGKITKEQAQAKIAELKKQATPANFEALVKANSDEPGAKERGGDLGWFAKGDMVPEFETVVFSQATGTISDVVETPFGYHLIYKIAERPLQDVRVRLIETHKLTKEEIIPPREDWKETKLTGKQLDSAVVNFDQRTGAVQVALKFDEEGTKLFADITKRNIGRPVAIFLDGQILSQPTVQNEILAGQAVITGVGSVPEAKLLARRLQSGALPVPIKLIAQQTVGPTLGAVSLDKSLHAGLVGFLLVALFMIVLYRLPGVISILALILYAALSSAVFKLIPVTLSLAGIAGFILSLGIAVDANVLIFERLKEEWKTGKGTLQALEEAFRRAWPSIRDGHATVLISCAVLYWFSSSIIRGFALTLAIGTILSLFTAVVSSRTMLRYVLGTRLGQLEWWLLKSKS